jgi:hypothetical protein
MAHPFSKMFEKALKKSSSEENFVLHEAKKLRAKGYRVEEIMAVLEGCKAGRIDDAETEIVEEALEEFSRYLAD